MNLEQWFLKFETETDTTESITNETFSYLASFEELKEEDKKFLNSLGYSDGEIEEIIEIMDEVE